MRVDRFRELIQHCRQKPGLNKFNFNVVAVVHKDNCGTAGCMMGEMPFCWPNEFLLHYATNWHEAGTLELAPCSTLQPDIKRWYTSTEKSVATAAAWFEIPYDEAGWLFLPYEELPKPFGRNNLDAESTLHDVIQNIERYIALKANEQCLTSNP